MSGSSAEVQTHARLWCFVCPLVDLGFCQSIGLLLDVLTTSEGGGLAAFNFFIFLFPPPHDYLDRKLFMAPGG